MKNGVEATGIDGAPRPPRAPVAYTVEVAHER
jgi:hypothetical protein